LFGGPLYQFEGAGSFPTKAKFVPTLKIPSNAPPCEAVQRIMASLFELRLAMRTTGSICYFKLLRVESLPARSICIYIAIERRICTHRGQDEAARKVFASQYVRKIFQRDFSLKEQGKWLPKIIRRGDEYRVK
jgi:hypothetical protein